MSALTIRKAIFPVAGLGTRFLPATKANPKEMLPIVDKPLIQYAVEEAIAAGVELLIFVTNISKRAIEDHFDSNYELESKLEERGKNELLKIVREILPKGISCVYIRQHNPLGLGHAVLCAKPIIGDEPFAVLLADDLIDCGNDFCLKQMLIHYQKNKGSVLAVEPVLPSETERYGIVAIENEQTGLISTIIEKPKTKQAPSNLAAVGRYILTPTIFAELEKIGMGAGNEIQLTDAISQLCLKESVYAYRLQGKRFDCGNKLGYIQATVAYALKHPEIGKSFQQHLQSLRMMDEADLQMVEG